MKKNEIKVGGKYRAKVNGSVVTVRVDKIVDPSKLSSHPYMRYEVTNLTTGRRTSFRSSTKFRSEVTDTI